MAARTWKQSILTNRSGLNPFKYIFRQACTAPRTIFSPIEEYLMLTSLGLKFFDRHNFGSVDHRKKISGRVDKYIMSKIDVSKLLWGVWNKMEPAACMVCFALMLPI